MCVLRVSGVNFDPRGFLRNSTIKACSGYLRGEPRRLARPDGPKCTTSGFTASVSDADWSDLLAQSADAVAFIEKHEAELLKLRGLPEVDDMRLDFPIERRDVFVQCDFFPSSLVMAAGRVGLGLELSVYPCGDDEEAGEERDDAEGVGAPPAEPVP